MKTTAQLNREYDAIQQKALKNKLLNNSINDTMKIKKQNKLVKTDKQAESAFIVFWSIIVGGILLAVTIILHYL